MIEKWKKLFFTNYLTCAYYISYVFLFLIGFPIWRKGIYWLADFINHTQTIGFKSEDIFYNFDSIVLGLFRIFQVLITVWIMVDLCRFIAFRKYSTPIVYTMAKRIFFFVSRLGILIYFLSEIVSSNSFYSFDVYVFVFIWLVTRFIVKPRLPINGLKGFMVAKKI